jgi:hypothetical protein
MVFFPVTLISGHETNPNVMMLLVVPSGKFHQALRGRTKWEHKVKRRGLDERIE